MFRKVWPKDDAFKDWVTSPEADENKDHYMHHRCDLNAEYQDMKPHEQSKKRGKSLSCKAVPITTSFIKAEIDKAHNTEGCIAMFSSCHCAITNCDHIVDM